MRKGNYHIASEAKFFRAIYSQREAGEAKRTGRLILWLVQRTSKVKLDKLGVHSVEFGYHSLRAGGAKDAANVGVPDLHL